MRLGSFVSAATFVVCAVAQNVFYDTTWGGPVRLAERFNGTAGGFDRVEATLVIPELAIPKNPHAPSDEYTAAYWIGLGGFLSSNVVKGLWQAGVIMSIWNNGSTEYMGFYEWVPNDPIHLNSSELAVSAGDHIHVVLNTTDNGMAGGVIMTNLNTSQTFSYGQVAPTTWRGPTWPALGDSAEWIVEAGTYINGPQYVFPDWNNATFLDSRACYDVEGYCVSPADRNDMSLNRLTAVWWNDTQTLYTKSHVDGNIVTVEYVEENLAM